SGSSSTPRPLLERPCTGLGTGGPFDGSAWRTNWRMRRASVACPDRDSAGGVDQRVDVVGHPAISDNDPVAPVDLIDKPLGESIIVSLVMEQLSSSVTSGDDVVDRIVVLQAWKARYQESRRPGWRIQIAALFSS